MSIKAESLLSDTSLYALEPGVTCIAFTRNVPAYSQMISIFVAFVLILKIPLSEMSLNTI